jgi:hypothetical protein
MSSNSTREIHKQRSAAKTTTKTTKQRSEDGHEDHQPPTARLTQPQLVGSN